MLNVLNCSLILGIRGEINVLVKVELFNDLNRFRQSSCGVKFFCSKFPFKKYSYANIYSYGIVLKYDTEKVWAFIITITS